MELQKKLPKARIVYASATGATEPRHMAYMVRLGIWGEGSPFRDFGDFLAAVEKRYIFFGFLNSEAFPMHITFLNFGESALSRLEFAIFSIFNSKSLFQTKCLST